MTLRRALVPLAFSLWLAGTLLLTWVLLVVPNQAGPGPDRDYVVDLPDNATPEQLGELLAREKVVAHPRAFAVYLRFMSEPEDLRRGSWVLNRAYPPSALLPRFVRGRGQAKVRVLIPEGFTQFDVATRLERFGVVARPSLLAAARDRTLLDSLEIPGPSAEGYLFPATYALHQDARAEDVLRRMVATFKKRTEKLLAADAATRAAQGLAPRSVQELITLASVVEREARMADEQPVIAGVFTNRLNDPTFRPHRLQADPTVAYGCLVAPERAASCREFDGRRITPTMVRDPDNPYNTYRHDGLPPGPIANPGLSALSAALSPAQHGYFYFVAKGGGRHAFAATLDEHNTNIHGPH